MPLVRQLKGTRPVPPEEEPAATTEGRSSTDEDPVSVDAPPTAAFGPALRSLRCGLGLSLGDLARLVNYSKSHLSRVETGKKQPTSDLAQHCDDALGGGGSLVRIAMSTHRRKTRAPRD